MDTLRALAQALLNDDQLDEALKQYRDIAEADPEDTSALIHIAEIQRRQGKYQEALTAIRKARKKDPDNLEAGYNEGLLLDVLGNYDEAAQDYEKMVDLTSHANGAYTSEEKNNRSIFLERLAGVYHEQNKVDEAVAAYQKMIELGGERSSGGTRDRSRPIATPSYTTRPSKSAARPSKLSPRNRDLKLMLAERLVDQGKADEALALAKGLIANTTDDRTVWLEVGQMYSACTAGRMPRTPSTRRTRRHRKGRQDLFVLSARSAGRAAEAL